MYTYGIMTDEQLKMLQTLEDYGIENSEELSIALEFICDLALYETQSNWSAGLTKLLNELYEWWLA